MKNFKNEAAQGELHVERVDSLPDGVELRDGERDNNGDWIVGHSESGHHHVVEARLARLLENPRDPDTCYLVCEADSPYFELVHRKPHSEDDPAHAPLRSEPGIFRVTRQSEVINRQRRRVMD
jgi:hypothetical protein